MKLKHLLFFFFRLRFFLANNQCSVCLISEVSNMIIVCCHFSRRVFLLRNKTRTSKVGAISKAQKAQNIFFGKKLAIFEKFFLSKKSHSAEKCKRGDPLGFINIHSVAKYEKNSKGDPFETLKFFSKSRTVPEKSKGGPFRHVRFCRFP